MSSDVAAMRALAHPTRVQILDLLRAHSSLTATACATILHLTPKTCSYHLQTLATHGFVSEIAVSGRNRPWQLTDRADQTSQTALPARPARTDAVRIRRDESLLDDAADAIASAASSDDWAEAATIHSRVATMTPEEMQAWYDDVERLTRRHLRRAADPAGESARVPVQLMFLGFPTPESA
jgi:predicted ArsR family transcriptional regulator